jgi:hypothetical protein
MLLTFLTCYEALGDIKLVGVCVCCVYGTAAFKEMSHTWQRCSMYFTPRHIDHVIAAIVNITVQRKQFSLVVDLLVMWCI